MDEKVYLMILFDYYGELLTDKQKEYFINYYFKDFSLSEIKENLNVSRNAIHKELKVVIEKLKNYEEKLGLYKRDKKLLKLVEEITDDKLKNKIKKIIE